MQVAQNCLVEVGHFLGVEGNAVVGGKKENLGEKELMP
jgi:hypothetical protein